MPVRSFSFHSLGLVVAALLVLPHWTAHATNKANNTDNLNLGSSWVGGVATGALDLGAWNSTVTAANTSQLGGNLSWQGISITNPGGAVTIQGAANTLTLGFAGINMNSATVDLTISSGLILGGAQSQLWNVASGRTLTVNGSSLVRQAGATLSVQGLGSVMAPALTNNATGIVGPWATIGTGTSTSYAFLDGTNKVSAYASTVVAGPSAITDTTGLINYETAAGGTMGAGAIFNTLRYTGAATSIAGNFSANGLLNAGTGALNFTGNVTIGQSQELVLNPASGAITVSGTIANHASGASALTKTGSGQVNLTGTNNSYTGLTVISEGVLDVGTISNNSLGSGGLLISGNAILQGNGTFTRTLSNNGTPGAGQVASQYGGFAARGGTLTLNFGGAGASIGLNTSLYIFGSNFVFGSPTSDSKVIVVNQINLNTNGTRLITVNQGTGTDSAEFQGQLIDGAAGLNVSGITKAGAGLLILANNTSTYTGATIITAGTVSVATIGNAGTASALGASTVANPASNLVIGGGTLRYTGATASSNRNFTLSAGSVSGAIEVTNAATNLTLSGSISSTTGALTKAGPGTLTLLGTNLHTGRTTITGGILDVGDMSQGLAGGGAVLIQNNSILQGYGTFTRAFSGNNTPGTNQVAGTDGGFAARGGVLTLNFGGAGATISLNTAGQVFGNNFIFGSPTADNKVVVVNPINLNSAGGARVFTVNSGLGGDYVELQGNISEGANSGLTKNGTGRLVIAGSANYNNLTTINAGTLQFARRTSLYNATEANWTAAKLIVNANATATFNVGGTNEFTAADIIALSALGTGTGGFRNNSRIGFDTTNATGGMFAYGTALANTNGGANVVGVTKQGTGALVLTATNTYTGPTTVTGGVLQVGQGGTGSTAAGSAVTVNGSDAVLAGSGTVNGATTVTQGTIRPGDAAGSSTGTLRTGALQFTPAVVATVAEFQITGSTLGANLSADRLQINGALSLSNLGHVVVDGTGYTAALGDSFTLMEWTGVLSLNGWSTGTNLRDGSTDNGSQFDLPSLFGSGFVWDISTLNNGATGGSLVITVVPEPGRAFLAVLGLAGCLLRRRRR